jgi:cytochrome c553
LIGLVALLAGVLHLMGRSRLANAPEVATSPVVVATNAEAIARGEHLVRAVSGCADCHGANLEGQVIIDEPPIGFIPAPNLTSGQGGVGATYTDEDWERAIRHGVGGDGRVLGVMPSHFYAHYGDEDLAALIAYIKTAPPVDNELPGRNIIFPGTILFGVLGYNTLPVALIDHEDVGAAPPPEGATAEYGTYLTSVAGCADCHSANFAGNTDPNGPPLGPNITPGSEVAGWTEADFINTIRTGVTPDGRELSAEMPWRVYANMTDTELQAIWAFLQNLEALPDNSG